MVATMNSTPTKTLIRSGPLHLDVVWMQSTGYYYRISHDSKAHILAYVKAEEGYLGAMNAFKDVQFITENDEAYLTKYYNTIKNDLDVQRENYMTDEALHSTSGRFTDTDTH